MFRWLHRFFYSDNPDVKLVAGVSQPEAEAWRELLANNGIPSMLKDMTPISTSIGGEIPSGPNNFDMWVRQSDFERAREVLAPFLEPNLPARPAGRRHVKVRRRPPS
jgi:hypothetical protein